jgi:hypothetical protein
MNRQLHTVYYEIFKVKHGIFCFSILFNVCAMYLKHTVYFLLVLSINICTNQYFQQCGNFGFSFYYINIFRLKLATVSYILW